MKTIKSFLYLSVLVGVSMFISSCNSPAKKGKQYAIAENKICENSQKELDKLFKAYTVDFNPKQFSCRQEAKDEWASRYIDITNRLKERINSNNHEIKIYVSGLDYKELEVFQMAYGKNIDATLNGELKQKIYGSEMAPEVLMSIAKIIPPKPDEKQMVVDLDKFSLSDVEGGYYYESKRVLKIYDYDITDFKIKSVETDIKADYCVSVSMTLCGKVNQDRRFDVQCKIRYILPEYDDWKIDFVKTEALTPISCDTYNECVKLIHSGGWIGKDLYVKNVCTKSLEVYVRYYEYNNWYKKVVVAKPQEETLVSWGEPDEERIDYILPL